MEEWEDVRHQGDYDRWESRESEAYVEMAGHREDIFKGMGDGGEMG